MKTIVKIYILWIIPIIHITLQSLLLELINVDTWIQIIISLILTTINYILFMFIYTRLHKRK